MKNSIGLLLLFIAIVVSSISCKKIGETEDNPENSNDIESLSVPATFDYNTADEVEIRVYVKNNQGIPIKNVRIDIYSDFQADGGRILASGNTDNQGLFHRIHPIPDYYDSIIVGTRYLGFANETQVAIANGEVNFTLGGESKGNFKSSPIPFKATNSVFHPMGEWDSNGLPLYLEPEDDVIDLEFLTDINASFPEGQPVPDYHPEYIEPENEYDFKLVDNSDVWITFVHEGAGYKNVLGYYTYVLGNAPTSRDDIDTINIIFPNVSFQGSGGSMATGNKVYLGEFPANTGIGWVLIANGWRSDGSITEGNGVYFSSPGLNPETDPDYQQHAVHLLDNGRDIFLLGFEDLNRMSWSDEDFNDAMFYITANPIQAVDLTGFETITYTSEDQDGDGVSNNFDDYPDDGDRAFNNYYPNDSVSGTLAFEDLWPGKGDYDFNDMIIDYQINQVTNGDNEVVEIFADFTLRAMGASFKNGFGIEIPISPEAIESVEGQNLEAGLIAVNANGTEAGQTNAVIIVFDNGYNVLPYPGGGGTGVNTDEGAPYAEPQTVSLTIKLVEPTPINIVGIPSYNPFIFTNQDRTTEIHLPDKPPTDLADQSKFGTSMDRSNPAENRYYKTQNNLPWAIHVVESFEYPTERSKVTDSYLNFGNWAETAGQNHSSWFRAEPGNRNEELIYKK
jgi:LruC domain-containing protein